MMINQGKKPQNVYHRDRHCEMTDENKKGFKWRVIDLFCRQNNEKKGRY